MTTRAHISESESSGSLSLIGVVTSIVGILLVLVTVVADRVWRSASQLATENVDLAALRQASQTLESDVNRLAGEFNAMRVETTDRKMERDRLATMLAAAEHDLADRRGALDAEGRKQFDLQRGLAQARADLDRLGAKRRAAVEAPNKVVKIENFPTPLSKPVDTKEVHFQLKGGRLCYVPMNEFMAQVGELFREKAWKLKDSPEFTDTYGPIDGYTVRYTMVREDVSWEDAVHTGHGGSTLVLDHVEFLPASTQLGESVEEATANKSAFNGRLDDLKPKHTTVTVWVYPDSFGEFRHIRKLLYQRGFTVAARPLSEWMNIGGSRHGSKSAAE